MVVHLSFSFAHTVFLLSLDCHASLAMTMVGSVPLSIQKQRLTIATAISTHDETQGKGHHHDALGVAMAWKFPPTRDEQ